MRNKRRMLDCINVRTDGSWEEKTANDLIEHLHKIIGDLPAEYRKSAKIELSTCWSGTKELLSHGLMVTYLSSEEEPIIPYAQRYPLDKNTNSQ